MRKNNAVALMSRIRAKANRFIIESLVAEGIEGIVPSHGEIMIHLFAEKDYTMQELAQKINRTKPTVTILVNKLVNYGYVYKEKSITDNRVTYIKLTPLGIALKPVFENISKDLNKIIDHILREDNLCDGLFSLIFVPFGFAVMGSVLWQFHSYRIS